jgi:hypothetical protein
MPELKLYVWEGVLRDYTSGIIVALAESSDDAREMVLKDFKGQPMVEEALGKVPECVTTKKYFLLYGGG